jgi:hypothetical protein
MTYLFFYSTQHWTNTLNHQNFKTRNSVYLKLKPACLQFSLYFMIWQGKKFRNFRQGKVKINRVTNKEFSGRLTISDHLTVKLIPGSPMPVKKILQDKGIEFMITGVPVFFSHIHYLSRGQALPIINYRSQETGYSMVYRYNPQKITKSLIYG